MRLRLARKILKREPEGSIIKPGRRRGTWFKAAQRTVAWEILERRRRAAAAERFERHMRPGA